MNFDLAGKRTRMPSHNGVVGEPCTVLVAEGGVLDLRRQSGVESWMDQHRPQAVVLAAAP